METEKRSPHDRVTDKECPECHGRGYTAATAPDLNKLGSGCPICLGTGRNGNG